MKYYKGDCHHYRVIDNHKALVVTLLGEYETSIRYDSYNAIEHHVIEYIKESRVKPCTKKDFDTAFAKALNTIKNLK